MPGKCAVLSIVPALALAGCTNSLEPPADLIDDSTRADASTTEIKPTGEAAFVPGSSSAMAGEYIYENPASPGDSDDPFPSNVARSNPEVVKVAKRSVGTGKGPRLVACAVLSENPDTLVYNKPPIVAVGRIVNCTNPPPSDCRLETDLQQYFPFEGEWSTVANGPVRWGCTPGKPSSASYKCTHDPRGPHKYRTRTYITVQVKGRWIPEVVTSAEKSWWCF